MNLCRQCFREKATDIGFNKVGFFLLSVLCRIFASRCYTSKHDYSTAQAHNTKNPFSTETNLNHNSTAKLLAHLSIPVHEFIPSCARRPGLQTKLHGRNQEGNEKMKQTRREVRKKNEDKRCWREEKKG